MKPLATFFKYFLSFILSLQLHFVDAQCERTVTITITSINFVQGCDFNESSGLDAVLEIEDLNGVEIYASEFENLKEVTGPLNDFIIDLAVHPNSCGNGDLIFVLGTFPSDQLTFDTEVQIFNRNNIFSCAPYFFLSDSNYGNDEFTFDLLAPSGTIDVGSCMSFNYELDSELRGEIETRINPKICFSDSVIVNGKVYNNTMPTGTETIVASGNQVCDTLVFIQLEFFPIRPIDFITDDKICIGVDDEIQIEDTFESYLWSTGDTDATVLVDQAGTYSVTATDENTCQAIASIDIVEHIYDDLIIDGIFEICEGSETSLSIDGSFSSIIWNTGEMTNMITVTEANTYSVTVTNDVRCEQMAEQIVVLNQTLLTQIDSFTCDPALVGMIDSSYVDVNGCMSMVLINVMLNSNADCEIEVEYNVTDVSCPGAEDGIIELEIINDVIPVDVKIYNGNGDLIIDDVIDQSFVVVSYDFLPVDNYAILLSKDQNFQIQINTKIEVENPLRFQTSQDQNISIGDSTTIELFLDENLIDMVTLTDGNQILCDTCFSLNVSPDQTTTYIFDFTDINSCSYSEAVTVTVSSDQLIYIPNIIDINAQNENSEFKLLGDDIQAVNEFSVFDRWGNLIFYTNDKDLGWNGFYNNEPVGSGIYVYVTEVVFTDGSTQIYRGQFLLVN